MLQGESGHSLITPACRSCLITGWMPAKASAIKGYCVTLGLQSDFGLICTGAAVVINPTSSGPFVRNEAGRPFSSVSSSSVNITCESQSSSLTAFIPLGVGITPICNSCIRSLPNKFIGQSGEITTGALACFPDLLSCMYRGLDIRFIVIAPLADFTQTDALIYLQPVILGFQNCLVPELFRRLPLPPADSGITVWF